MKKLLVAFFLFASISPAFARTPEETLVILDQRIRMLEDQLDCIDCVKVKSNPLEHLKEFRAKRAQLLINYPELIPQSSANRKKLISSLDLDTSAPEPSAYSASAGGCR